MSNKEVTTLSFNSIALNPVMRNGQIWMTASDLAKALDYSDVRSITKIHSRNVSEFTPAMTTVVNMTTVRKTGNVEMDNRIFSLRGCHLIAMFARTKVAKDFRVWVLDILDAEVGAPAPMSVSNAEWTRYLQALTIPEMVQLTGHDQKSVISGLYHATHSRDERVHQQPSLPNLPPQVQTALDQFWDTVSQLDLQQINHSRDPEVLAISLPELYTRAGEQLPQRRSMLSALKHSLIPQFKDSNHAINSTITGSTKKCWVFVMPTDQESQLEK